MIDLDDMVTLSRNIVQEVWFGMDHAAFDKSIKNTGGYPGWVTDELTYRFVVASVAAVHAGYMDIIQEQIRKSKKKSSREALAKGFENHVGDAERGKPGPDSG